MQENEAEIDNSPINSFFVFHHNPFKQGNEGTEDTKIFDQLIYKYPESVTDRMIEHLLGIIISIYSFATLSLKRSKVDFMQWKKSKIAIRTTVHPDGTLIFFVLRILDIYSDTSAEMMVELLKNGIFFAMGPDQMSSIPALQKYLEIFGKQICSKVLPNETTDPLQCSFHNLPNAEWHRSSVATILTEVTLMQTYPELWGIVCFVDGLLLVSHSPINIVRYFDFVSDQKQVKVYLTRENRASLLDFPGSIAKIPDNDIIEAHLHKFQYEVVSFYIIADPNLPNESLEKIHEALNHIMPDIVNVTPDTNPSLFPPNTLVYNRVLNMLRAGQSNEDFQKTVIYGHDTFAREPYLRDLVMHNIKEFSICMNIVNFEHYASVNGGLKMTLMEMYDEALKANPELLPFLQSFHPSH